MGPISEIDSTLKNSFKKMTSYKYTLAYESIRTAFTAKLEQETVFMLCALYSVKGNWIKYIYSVTFLKHTCKQSSNTFVTNTTSHYNKKEMLTYVKYMYKWCFVQ